MQITRRQMVWLALAASCAPGLPARAASDDTALFWQFGAPGATQSVIFGYERIAASLVPDIIAEGSKRVAAADSMVQDFHPTVSLPKMQVDQSKMAPIWSKLDDKTATALRTVLSGSFPKFAPLLDKMTGIEATMLLMAEGQTPANPTVGGTIAEHGLSLGKPSTVLISDDEVRRLVATPDLVAIDNRVDQDTIAYMLALRDKGGPIGGQFEKLYEARRSGDIHQLAGDLDKHGVFSPSKLLHADKIETLLTDRLEQKLKAPDTKSAFVLLPLDTLIGDNGIVAALRKRGNDVTPLA